MTQPHSHRPISLTLDFDSTLTTSDTLSLLCQIPYNLPNAPQLPKWSHFVTAYEQDLHSITTSQPPPRSPAQAIASQRALRPAEDASIARVLHAGLFAHVTPAAVASAAADAVRTGEVELRWGWLSLVRFVLEHNRRFCGGAPGGVSVVSTNWSRRWVCGVLLAAAARASPSEDEGGGVLRDVRVLAEEVVCPGEGLPRGSGGDAGGKLRGGVETVRTSEDKARVMRSCVADFLGGVDVERGKVLRVYVGDSPTDLECLLETGIGVCVRDEEMSGEQTRLRDVLEGCGVHVEQLRKERVDMGNGEGEEEGKLVWTRDLGEVEGMLRRLVREV